MAPFIKGDNLIRNSLVEPRTGEENQILQAERKSGTRCGRLIRYGSTISSGNHPLTLLSNFHSSPPVAAQVRIAQPFGQTNHWDKKELTPSSRTSILTHMNIPMTISPSIPGIPRSLIFVRLAIISMKVFCASQSICSLPNYADL
jgi:hypothetical protein